MERGEGMYLDGSIRRTSAWPLPLPLTYFFPLTSSYQPIQLNIRLMNSFDHFLQLGHLQICMIDMHPN